MRERNVLNRKKGVGMSNSAMRAPQRQRSKALDSSENDAQPLFLRKAFNIISNCPREIGGWSEDGQSFIIQDVEKFASTIIPTAFKHSKFSSFVRQLNFYGFKKIRNLDVQNTNLWEFKHPLFRRGDLESLSKIKKSAHFVEDSSSNDHSEFKEQLSYLGDRMNYLDMLVEELSRALREFTANSNPLDPIYEPATKKRKMDNLIIMPPEVSLERTSSLEILGSMVRNISDSGDGFDAEFWDAMKDIESFDFNNDEISSNNTTSSLSNTPVDALSTVSVNVVSVTDSDLSDSSKQYLALDIAMNRSEKVIESAEISDIEGIVSMLPAHLAERFVDRLATSLGDKLSKNFSLPICSSEVDKSIEHVAESETTVAGGLSKKGTLAAIKVTNGDFVQKRETCLSTAPVASFSSFPAPNLSCPFTSVALQAALLASLSVYNSSQNHPPQPQYQNFYTTPRPRNIACTGAEAFEPSCY